MTLVVDSSIAASWGLPDEYSHAALEALSRSRGEAVVVPGHFWHELRNVFLVNERRGRCSQGQTAAGLTLVEALRPLVDVEADGRQILDLARRHMLTAYDAAYMELALRLQAMLASNDAALIRAARSAGCRVISDS